MVNCVRTENAIEMKWKRKELDCDCDDSEKNEANRLPFASQRNKKKQKMLLKIDNKL